MTYKGRTELKSAEERGKGTAGRIGSVHGAVGMGMMITKLGVADPNAEDASGRTAAEDEPGEGGREGELRSLGRSLWATREAPVVLSYGHAWLKIVLERQTENKIGGLRGEAGSHEWAVE